MAQKKQLDHIGFVLGELVGKKNWESRFELHQVFSFWAEIVGPEVAAQAKPYKMHGTVLWVAVTDSVWLHQLQYLKMAFVENINQRFSSVELTDIRFSLQRHGQEDTEHRAPEVKPGPSPSSEDKAAFAKMVASIPDPELRHSIERCWQTLYLYKDR